MIAQHFPRSDRDQQLIEAALLEFIAAQGLSS